MQKGEKLHTKYSETDAVMTDEEGEVSNNDKLKLHISSSFPPFCQIRNEINNCHQSEICI